ncbi:hypothetical protein JCM8097_003761, partial [Rhodosporidiobolus ruineniae]
MSSEDRLVSSPAACLSEEAMDLICSFVREFEDDRDMASALCALSLTSRRWTSSAVRALYFDPSRSLRRRHRPVQACWLLSSLTLQDLRLGSFVRELQRLPDKHDAPREFCDSARTSTWILALIRTCPNLSAINIPAGTPVDWALVLPTIPRLQQLTVSPVFDTEWVSHEAFNFLWMVHLPQLRSLTLFLLDNEVPMGHGLGTAEIDVDFLELSHYHFHPEYSVPLIPVKLRHLRLRPFRCSQNPGSWIFSSSIEILESLPIGERSPPPDHPCRAYYAEHDRCDFPYHPLPTLPNLRQLSLEFIFVDLNLFTSIAMSYPTLRTLSLKDSIWALHEWEGFLGPLSALFVAFEAALNSLPSLISLDLGWVPVYTHGALYCIQAKCEERGIDLVFKPSLVREALRRQRREARAESCYSEMSLSPSTPVSEYETEHEPGHNDLDRDFPSPSSFPRSDWPLLPPPFLQPTGVPSSSSSSDAGDDSGFFESLPVLPTSSPRLQPDLSLDSLFSAVFPSPPLSPSPSPSLPPSRSPSPVFLPATPDQPRFEPDYQPLDFGEKSQEDFDSGDAEEWRRWEGLDEVE